MGLISKIKGKLAYWKRGIGLYILKNTQNSLSENGNYYYQEFFQIQSLTDYDMANEKRKDYESRFSKGEILCVLEKDKKIIAYGWINPNPNHLIGELVLQLEYGDKCEVLYDFETDVAYRGKGLYPFLLQRIGNRNHKPKLIYVLVENKSSIKGIEKAGFRHLGNIYGYNKKKANHLLRKLWQE